MLHLGGAADGVMCAQVAALCEKASSEVEAGQGVQIANFLCPGNYAISGGIAVRLVTRVAPLLKVPPGSHAIQFIWQMHRIYDLQSFGRHDDHEPTLARPFR